MAAGVLAIVQARQGSTRLPGKSLEEIAGRPMLAHVLMRAAAVPGVDRVVLATTTRSEDDELARQARAAAPTTCSIASTRPSSRIPRGSCCG